MIRGAGRLQVEFRGCLGHIAGVCFQTCDVVYPYLSIEPIPNMPCCANISLLNTYIGNSVTWNHAFNAFSR